jgi:hypothetical protein
VWSVEGYGRSSLHCLNNVALSYILRQVSLIIFILSFIIKIVVRN